MPLKSCITLLRACTVKNVHGNLRKLCLNGVRRQLLCNVIKIVYYTITHVHAQLRHTSTPCAARPHTQARHFTHAYTHHRHLLTRVSLQCDINKKHNCFIPA